MWHCRARRQWSKSLWRRDANPMGEGEKTVKLKKTTATYLNLLEEMAQSRRCALHKNKNACDCRRFHVCR
jgi:hypothetical protein